MRYACLLLAMAGFAADTSSEPVLWSAQSMKAFDQKLAVKSQTSPNKVGAEIVTRYGNHLMWLVHREGPGAAEWHVKESDTFIVNSGEATVIVGGNMVGKKSTGPNEFQGPSIEGGTRTKIGPGDVFHIPANIPHQVMVEPGTKFSYMILKVNAD
jgi:mannose-6-phosphate isomerase-like protein (cupin superfamily)